MEAKAGSSAEPNASADYRMARIWLHLLTRAALCAGLIALLAGMVAAIFPS